MQGGGAEAGGAGRVGRARSRGEAFALSKIMTPPSFQYFSLLASQNRKLPPMITDYDRGHVQCRLSELPSSQKRCEISLQKSRTAAAQLDSLPTVQSCNCTQKWYN